MVENAIYRYKTIFVRDRDGTITGMRVGTDRARNLWFDRQ
jgi:hypothetical protein